MQLKENIENFDSFLFVAENHVVEISIGKLVEDN